MVEAKLFSDFAEVKPVWEQLWKKSGGLTVYQSPEYAALVLRHFAPYRILLRAKPVFAVCRQAGEPVLLLPLLQRMGGGYDLFGHRCGCGYLDGVYGAETGSAAIAACMDALRSLLKQPLHFRRVREETPLGEWLLTHGGERAVPSCTMIDLPEDYDAYYNGLSKHMRQNLRTAYNRLARDHCSMEFSAVSARDVPAAQREALMDVYIDRQVSQYHHLPRSIFSVYANRVDIAAQLVREYPETDTFILTINGAPAAYMDALRDKDTLRIPRLAIDASYGAYSPGILLLNESIKVLIEQGQVRILDLTHGDEAYKRAMGGRAAYCVSCDLR